MADDLRRGAKEVFAKLAGAELSAQESAAHWRRLRAMVDRQPPPRVAWTAGGVAVAAALAAVIVTVGRVGDAPWARLAAPADCDELSITVDAIEVPGVCQTAVTVALGEDRVVLEPATRLVREATRMRLVMGRGAFAVAPRPPDVEPFALAVSHGRVVVLGTRFVAAQGIDSGEVELLAGAIAFHWQDGVVDTLQPGARLRWPRTASEPPREAPQGRTQPGSPAEGAQPLTPGLRHPSSAKLDMQQLLRDLLQLQRGHRYDDAIALLRDVVDGPRVTEQQRKQLSVELGILLRLHADAAEACRHWELHAARFGSDPTVVAELAACAADAME